MKRYYVVFMRYISEILCPHFWEELAIVQIQSRSGGEIIGWHHDRRCTRCGKIERASWTAPR